MNRPKNIIVVCEGESEWTYLQRLNSFLASLPFPDGWLEVPVRFIGRPPKTGIGTGAYKSVERELRKVGHQNPLVEKWAWVDADLYVRNDKSCGDSYRNRPLDIPPFMFSIFNFEDFLALHLDDFRFTRWIELMTEAGHFTSPLHWEDYKIPFAEIIPGYRKASLSADFVCRESLANLRRHLTQFPTNNFGSLNVERTFARSLFVELDRWYTLRT